MSQSITSFISDNINPLVSQFRAESNPLKLGELLLKIDEEVRSAATIFSTAKEDIGRLENLQRELSGKLERHSVEPVTASSPVGIARGETSWCWALSILQLIANAPRIKAQILSRRHPGCNVLAGLLEAYDAAKAQGKPVADAIDQNALRGWIQEMGIDTRGQADAYDGLTQVLRALGMSYVLTQEFHSVVEGETVFVEQSETLEKMAMIPLDMSGGQRSFKDLFLTSRMEDGRIKKLKFQKPPDDLVIYADRNRQVGRDKSFRSYKIEDDLQMPMNFELEGSRYELASCLIHTGQDNNGHYVSLVKKPDGWYLIDDDKREKVPSEKVAALVAKGYIFHYSNPTANPPSLTWRVISATAWVVWGIARLAFYPIRAIL